MIDWSKPSDRVTPNFTVRECLLLPSWGVLHIPSEAEKAGLIKVCELLEKVRFFASDKLKRDCPITVTCMIRPKSVNAPGHAGHGKDYNKFVKGASRSAHIGGQAVDFYIKDVDCDRLRKLLVSKLEEWQCRMESLHGAGWVHMDLYPPTDGRRYFKPL